MFLFGTPSVRPARPLSHIPSSRPFPLFLCYPALPILNYTFFSSGAQRTVAVQFLVVRILLLLRFAAGAPATTHYPLPMRLHIYYMQRDGPPSAHTPQTHPLLVTTRRPGHRTDILTTPFTPRRPRGPTPQCPPAGPARPSTPARPAPPTGAAWRAPWRWRRARRRRRR